MTLPAEVEPLVREFANNSYRYLFRRAENMKDLVNWRVPTLAKNMDFTTMQVEPDSFISPGFAQLESDILVRVQWRQLAGKDQMVHVYILVEHQSEPDDAAVFRALRYVLQVYDRQEKEWLKTHANTRGIKFNPVLPIVFYSGTRTWENLKPMSQLVHFGEQFCELIPALTPHFVNLHKISAEDLQSKAGILGWVLWLIQQKRSRQFRSVLGQVVEQLDPLHTQARSRWEHLLWFAHSMVYNVRKATEHQPLADFIRSTVRSANPQEVQTMSQTIAEALIEQGQRAGVIEGALNAKRQILLTLLKAKFKRVPAAIKTQIETTENASDLDAWLLAFANADKLTDIGFNVAKK